MRTAQELPFERSNFPWSCMLLGWGRLGQGLAYSMRAQGFPLHTAWNRSPHKMPLSSLPLSVGPLPLSTIQRADVLLLAVADDAIGLLGQRLLDEQALRPGHIVLHCSGKTSPATLAFLLAHDVHPGSMHPLQPIAGTKKDRLFEGIAVGIEGAVKARACAWQIAARLGAHPFSLEGVNRPLYHASACAISNFAVTLASMATQWMQQAGIPQENALSLLLPLLRQTVDNLEQKGLPTALTGPIARGDAATVRAHLAQLQHDPQHQQIYRDLAAQTLPLAQQIFVQQERIYPTIVMEKAITSIRSQVSSHGTNRS